MENKESENAYSEHLNTSHELGKALVTTNFDNALDYAEIGLDSFVSNEVLKEIPIVKTIVGVVRGGLKVKEIFFAKKILTFLKEFHSRKLSQDKLSKFKSEFKEDYKYREKIIEQIMIFNETFIQIEKSKVFANLFAAHLNEKYGWDDFLNLSMCLQHMNMYGVDLLHNMAKFKTPFYGALHDDTSGLLPLLNHSGIVLVWGNHLDITPYGLYLYYYGILGNADGDIKKAYPQVFKSDATQA
jgi:hypothetical protein